MLVFETDYGQGKAYCCVSQRYYCILNCVINLFGKISAQPHTPLCIQFLDRENNDKNNIFPLGKQICFTIVWGCAEILFIFLSKRKLTNGESCMVNLPVELEQQKESLDQ